MRHLNLARYHAEIGEDDRALEYLSSWLGGHCVVEAVRTRARAELAADPHFARLSADPRFVAFVSRP